ncbi:uncharacterized protein LOC123678927 [Harmonia axyridis]|uniref:uncharacterized protein LOC123678927 n=1 Tax=Harmonia axyridis TaxID=115357 RepID=UPI001E278766|nr:uncharacterized protein LOC123678927 [Harmonia axyridis]
MYVLEILFLFATFFLDEIFGHGMMLEPPNRSALWKYYPVDNHKVVPNYNMNQLFCGGFSLQWDRYKGKCGLCGDPYNAPHPQENENTGRYGKFGPVRSYGPGSVVNVKIQLTANHKGKFRYSLCVLHDPSRPESGEECFQPLRLADGRADYDVSVSERVIHNAVKLPDGLRCDRCVLRWEYTAGNNWGYCPDGSGRLGCGAQESYRNCADIRIQ